MLSFLPCGVKTLPDRRTSQHPAVSSQVSYVIYKVHHISNGIVGTSLSGTSDGNPAGYGLNEPSLALFFPSPISLFDLAFLRNAVLYEAHKILHIRIGLWSACGFSLIFLPSYQDINVFALFLPCGGEG